jgi:hypothetical protein
VLVPGLGRQKVAYTDVVTDEFVGQHADDVFENSTLDLRLLAQDEIEPALADDEDLGRFESRQCG